MVRVCCPTLIKKLSTEYPKLHYTSPDERFVESSPSVNLSPGCLECIIRVDGKVVWLKSL